MPELPEVDTLISSMRAAKIENSTILDVKIFYSKIIAAPTVSLFKKLLKNTKIIKISRIGKYIVFSLSSKYYLVVHLRMTGHFHLSKIAKEPVKHEHIIFF